MVCIVMSQRQFTLFMWLLVYDVKPTQMHSTDRKVVHLQHGADNSFLPERQQLLLHIKRKFLEKVPLCYKQAKYLRNSVPSNQHFE